MAEPKTCDVVVIGAGVGGLTAAVMLAKAGLSVTVLEMAARPGGYLAGFDREGFAFDTSIHWLNQCGEGGLVRRIFDFLGPGSPVAPPQTRIRRYKGEGFDYLLTSNPDELKEQWLREFPEDGPGIQRFFADAKQLGEAFRRLATRARATETMGALERVWYHLSMMSTSWPFLRHVGRSAQKGVARYFKSERLRSIFCSEQDLMSCLVPVGWAYSRDFQLAPQGGSRSFIQWLCRCLAAFGGTLEQNTRVSEVLLEGKKAVGVRAARGGESFEVRCGHVVAACDLEALYERMLPKGTVGPRLLAKLKGADLYDSSVTLSIGLNRPAQELGFNEELIFLTRGGLSRAEHSEGDPEKAGINVFSPSVRDPSLCAPGKGTLTVYASANIRYGDCWKTEPGLKRGPAYKAFKKQYAEVLLARIEAALAPGLRQAIEHLDIATPVTHLRYTGNRDGSLMGERASFRNIRAGIAHYLTPVEGLILGGQWAEYGGGVPVAVRAGANAAAIVLERERPSAFEVLKGVLDGRVDPTRIETKALKALPPALAEPAPTSVSRPG